MLQQTENRYDVRSWHNRDEIFELRSGDTIVDNGRVFVKIDRFYRHERYGWIVVFTNGKEIEMAWLSPRLGEEIEHRPAS